MKASRATAFSPDQTLADRLLAHAQRAESGCLLWTGWKTNRGYGLISNGPMHERRQVTTHRAAFTVWIRPLRDGEHVLHHCDTPACIEPTHLFAGDHSANMRDMIAKGRRKHEVIPDQAGQAHSQTHLTNDDVRRIRSRRASGEPLLSIAADYDISKGTVSNISLRRSWKHLT